MKKILITGATDGIGLAASKKLIEMGHHLILHGRNQSKLEQMATEIQATTDNPRIEVLVADLSNFADIKTMLNTLRDKHQSLDILINNAGVLKTPVKYNNDGLDVRFMVNTIAPVIIAESVLPLLANNGRIINLSSAAQAPVDIDALLGNIKIVEDFQAYAQSKLAISIWSQEKATLLKKGQVMIALNPGSLLASKMVKQGFGIDGHDIGIGVKAIIDAALSTDFENASGKYFDNDAKKFSRLDQEAASEQNCKRVMDAISLVVEKYY